MTKKKGAPGTVFVLAALVLALAGCGGGNPKALAKQTYDIGLQALGAMFDPAKAAELEKKVEDIEKKVVKLSPADRVIYDEELVRLGEEAAAAALGGLFKAAGGLFDAGTKAVNEANGKSIEDLLSFFEDSGITVCEKERSSYHTYGEIDSYTAYFDDVFVFILKYDPTSDILQNAERDGTLASSLCFVNSPFIIQPNVGGILQKDKEKISSVLQKFQVQ
jgi:hypothetical protein